MQSAFMKELDEFVIVYSDDVPLYSRSRGEHYRHSRIVLQRMRDAPFFVKLSKWGLVVQRVRYLGLLIEPGRVGPDPDNVAALNNEIEGP